MLMLNVVMVCNLRSSGRQETGEGGRDKEPDVANSAGDVLFDSSGLLSCSPLLRRRARERASVVLCRTSNCGEASSSLCSFYRTALAAGPAPPPAPGATVPRAQHAARQRCGRRASELHAVSRRRPGLGGAAQPGAGEAGSARPKREGADLRNVAAPPPRRRWPALGVSRTA